MKIKRRSLWKNIFLWWFRSLVISEWVLFAYVYFSAYAEIFLSKQHNISLKINLFELQSNQLISFISSFICCNLQRIYSMDFWNRICACLIQRNSHHISIIADHWGLKTNLIILILGNSFGNYSVVKVIF